jgi:isoquinoline 1-oxidoreductase subunit alpha
MALTLTINGVARTLDADPEMPLLWALRDVAGLTGTKYGCGIAACGACTVLIDGAASRSCSIPIGEVTGAVQTVEGLGGDPVTLALRQAWAELNVAQCGYCQTGQIVTAHALLADALAAGSEMPDEAAIAEAMDGNLCRCGTYAKIRAGVLRAAELLKAEA